MDQGNQRNQALQFHSSKNFKAAEEIYLNLLKTDKDDAYILSLMAECVWEDERYPEAFEYHERAVAAWEGLLRRGASIPDRTLVLYPWSLQVLGQMEQAIDTHRMIRRAYPFCMPNRFRLGICLLEMGDFSEAWDEVEHRWALGMLAKVICPLVPEWQGEPLRGKTILVLCIEGAGDIIHMLRFVPQLAAAGANVVLSADPPLRRLVKMLDAPFRLEQELGAEPIHFHCPVSSLPRFLCRDITAIPRAPYLRLPVQVADTKASRLNVGIVWAGSAAPHTTKRRSMPLAAMLPILRTPGCAFLSLQVGPPAVQIRDLPQDMVLPTLRVTDWADTAAVIATLDLVIAVDTGTAHLAGALGKPVWMLNRYNGDWRWFRDRLDSPWYPSMRIFRQPYPGDWSTVVAEVAAELRTLAAQSNAAAVLCRAVG